MRKQSNTTSAGTSHNGPVNQGVIVSVDRAGGAVGAGELPTVKVTKEGGGAVTAVVPQPTAGDRLVPRVGSHAYYLRASSGSAVLLGVFGVEHDGYREQRRIDHAHSDSSITFTADGDVEIEAEGEIRLNGTPVSELE